MYGFIALYLIACLDPTNHNTCVSLPVTDSAQAQIGEEVLGGSSGYAQGVSLRRLVLSNRK
jgi:hypothetical protein